MYQITWWDKDNPDAYRRKVQYLADVAEVVRDAFGVDEAVKVTIVKED